MLVIVYLILSSPVLDPPTIESHSAQCIVASTSYNIEKLQKHKAKPISKKTTNTFLKRSLTRDRSQAKGHNKKNVHKHIMYIGIQIKTRDKKNLTIHPSFCCIECFNIITKKLCMRFSTSHMLLPFESLSSPTCMLILYIIIYKQKKEPKMENKNATTS